MFLKYLCSAEEKLFAKENLARSPVRMVLSTQQFVRNLASTKTSIPF